MRRLIVFLVIIGVLGGGIFLFVKQQTVNANAQRPHLRTAKVDRGDLEQIVTASGSIAPEQSVKLSFETPGLVKEILVEEGQHVHAGDILARQDDGAQRLALAQAQASQRVAELSLKELTSPVSQNDLAVAQANVTAAEGAYKALFATVNPNAVKAAELRYQEAQTAAQDAVDHRKRMGGQYPEKSTTYQLALAQEGQAAFTAEIARLQLDIYKRGPDGRAVAAAKAQIDAAKARLEQVRAGLPALQIDQAQLAIEQAKVAVTQAQNQLDNTVLRAPFDAVVTTIGIKVGSLSLSSIPAIILTDTSKLHVDIQVDESDIGQLRTEEPVRLTFSALPDTTVTGAVDYIGLVATQGTTGTSYTVRVRIDPSDAPVRSGMTSNATVIIRQLHNALRVPNLYIRIDRRNNQAYANIVNAEGQLTELPVQLGLRTEEYSEVISGLDEGDTVGIDLNAGGFSLF